MAKQHEAASPLQCHPLTPARWDDFERLFGKSGAYGGCWCMWWRVTRSTFSEQQGEGNRQAMHDIVFSGEIPGILGYVDGEPAAWCSIAPRDNFGSLNRSPVLRRLDDQPVWSLVCLYVGKRYRGRGLTQLLIRDAIAYAAAQGATIVEAYPTAPRGKELAPVSVFMGTPRIFARAGFVECARPSVSKVIMRYEVVKGAAAEP